MKYFTKLATKLRIWSRKKEIKIWKFSITQFILFFFGGYFNSKSINYYGYFQLTRMFGHQDSNHIERISGSKRK